MGADPLPPPITVTGGSDGISADCDRMVELARGFGGAATDTLAAAVSLHTLVLGGAVVSSAVLDPAGFAAFEGELLWALDGPGGLGWAGAGCGALDGELRLAAASYRTADRLATDVHDLVDGLLGAPPAAGHGLGILARTGDPIAAAEAVVADDPALADVLLDGLGVPGAIAGVAHRLPDGHGVVRDAGRDGDGPAGAPPRGLADVLGELSRRDGEGTHGAIDVRILTLADGTRRVIVDITGTKSWDPFPTSDVTSLTTNGRALVGERTAYEQGVLAAMHRAGVRRTDRVMLVGHSQGGMVAVTTARDAVRNGEFNVTHVVTAGSPIGRTVGQVPSSVQVLALENARDVVPHLDGRANPDRRNVTTATAEEGDRTVTGDHGLDTAYVPLAADVQASGNRSLTDFLTGAGDFFRGVRVTTHVYQVRRSY